MSEREHCGNCVFGINFGSVHGELDCHKRSPIVFEGITGYSYTPTGSGSDCIQIVKEIRGQITAWPRVREIDFCGEWELKDAK